MGRIDVSVSGEPSDYKFAQQVRVRFAETDAMGVVHHAAYLLYLEETRVSYLRSIGHPYDEVRAQGTDFPVIEIGISYLRPAHFDEIVSIHVAVVDVRGATFQLAYLLQVGPHTVATAVTAHAAVDRDSGQPKRVPKWLVVSDRPDRPSGPDQTASATPRLGSYGF